MNAQPYIPEWPIPADWQRAQQADAHQFGLADKPPVPKWLDSALLIVGGLGVLALVCAALIIDYSGPAGL